MNQNPSVESGKDPHNALLAAALLQNSQQLARLERNFRLTLLLLAFLCTGMLVGGYSLLGSKAAYASDQGIVREVEQAVRRDARHVEQWAQNASGKLNDIEQRGKADFDNTIEKVRTDLSRAGNFEPLHAVAVILQDMKSMLEAVPRMADNMETMTTAMTEMNVKMSAMPNMAVDMHQMNYNMAVIAHDIDETMGRVGRMSPW